MRNQTKLHLEQLQITMQQLNLWQTMPPAAEAFLSEEPFSLIRCLPKSGYSGYLFHACRHY